MKTKIIDKSKLSPMMQHYYDLKQNYQDCLIFYRLGDFYELFFEDAIKASEILDLTLTGRDCGNGQRAEMCGVPYHAVDVYLNKLVSAGEKVAICEQLNDPVKGQLVERNIVRIVTAGTVIEDSQIDEKSNNFIMCIYSNDNNFASAWCDITTGEFYTQNFVGEKALFDLVDNMVKISPTEIISNTTAYSKLSQMPVFTHGILPKLNAYVDSQFNYQIANETLKKQFNTRTLFAYKIENDVLSIPASGALISYLNETQKHPMSHINKIVLIQNNDYMHLDSNAIKNLEITSTLRDGKRYGSLLWVLDKTKTNMGARTLKTWILSPLQKIDEINYRLDGVKALYSNTLVRQGLSDLFKSVKDIGRLTGKISNGNLMPKDCIALAKSLEVIPSLKFQLIGLTSQIINDLNNEIVDFSSLAKWLKSAILEDTPPTLKEGGYIKKGFNEELDQLHELSNNAKEIINQIEQREKEETGIKTLKIHYNRVFGYYIEVTNSFKNLVPYHYQRKQTLANCERFFTDELKEIEEKILTSQEKAIKLEHKLYNEIKNTLLEKIDVLKNASFAIGKLDVLTSLAQVAKENDYVMPTILPSDKPLNIVDGRHPVVESISKDQFVTNDTFLDCCDSRTMIITGPNMAGKSTYMRQVAIISLLAHIGSFVPAKSAEIPIIDAIYTRVGASDNLVFDQSTFMVEMTEVAEILLNATNKSLLILDEIGRGTSTYDGLSIAWSVLEYINNTIKAKSLFATHYHELTELENIQGVKNYKITVKEFNNSIVFMRKIVRGSANKSFGVEVASLAGVPESVTNRAKQILKSLEKNNLNKKVETNAENDTALNNSEVERILLDLNINKITPIDAFNILLDLKTKIGD